MRIRPLSYAALLLCLFFCTAAFSEKKNSIHIEGAGEDENFYNSGYKKRAAESNGDIISFNKKYKNSFDDEEYNEKREIDNSGTEKKIKSSAEYVYYIVKNGDTLFGIAKRSAVSLELLQDCNNLTEKSRIYKGMKLKIPSKNVKIKERKSNDRNTVSIKPGFLWPLKKVKGYSRDGGDGIKPIGIIIKGNPGGEVIASEDGVVKKVGYMRGYGKYIVVKHEKRYITVYSNLLDIDVKAGDSVHKGGRIGNISEDMTLHFQIDRGGKPENPITLLPGRG